MSVWYAIPSARPVAEANRCLGEWSRMGYKPAVLIDPMKPFPQADRIIEIAYRGYAQAVNCLVHHVLAENPDCGWVVTGGDDVFPDAKKRADDIAAELTEHFRGTFGVMQPCGHRWGDSNGAYIDRAAGSPWMGREFCRRIYGGKGPLWPEFTHMFVDEHLQCVATKLGIFRQRHDIHQVHQHWALPRPGERLAPSGRMPEFLEKANSPEHWRQSKAIFDRLRAGGFAEANDLLP